MKPSLKEKIFVDNSTSPTLIKFDSSDSPKHNYANAVLRSNMSKPPHQHANASGDVTSGATSASGSNKHDKVDKDGFTLVTHGKQNSNANKESGVINTKRLTGINADDTTELYVQNIAKYSDESLRDVANKVKAWCKDKGFLVYSARVITNKYNDHIVGCRIIVPIRKADDMLGNRIWPDKMLCRRWKSRPSNKPNGERRNHGFHGTLRAPNGSSHQSRSRSRSRGHGNKDRSRSRSHAGKSRSRSRSNQNRHNESRNRAGNQERRADERRGSNARSEDDDAFSECHSEPDYYANHHDSSDYWNSDRDRGFTSYRNDNYRY